jgi:molecular chaperone DnaK (HSP70)
MRAQRQLESAAASAGFKDIEFQFEPIAAALHYEVSVAREEIALVADIGGGTSDFSVVRVSPQRSLAADRKADILVLQRHPHRRHQFRPPAQSRQAHAPARLPAAR